VRRLLLAALLLAACKRENELPSGHIVVRDASGAVTRELRAMPYGYLAKPDNVRIAVSGGTIDAGPLRYENGKLVESGQPRASVERKDDRIVIFDSARAPLGQLVARDGETWVYDGGGTPLGRAKTDKDRVLLLDRDGGGRGYVGGISQQGAAAFLLGAKLTEIEKAVLALSLR
jgi:hypothetical protein